MLSLIRFIWFERHCVVYIMHSFYLSKKKKNCLCVSLRYSADVVVVPPQPDFFFLVYLCSAFIVSSSSLFAMFLCALFACGTNNILTWRFVVLVEQRQSELSAYSLFCWIVFCSSVSLFFFLLGTRYPREGQKSVEYPKPFCFTFLALATLLFFPLTQVS